jgi:clumping factor A
MVRNTEVKSETTQNTEVNSELLQNTEVNSEMVQNTEVNSEIVQNTEVNSEMVQKTEVKSEMFLSTEEEPVTIQKSQLLQSMEAKCLILQNTEVQTGMDQDIETNPRMIQNIEVKSGMDEDIEGNPGVIENTEVKSGNLHNTEVKSGMGQDIEANPGMIENTEAKSGLNSESDNCIEVSKVTTNSKVPGMIMQEAAQETFMSERSTDYSEIKDVSEIYLDKAHSDMLVKTKEGTMNETMELKETESVQLVTRTEKGLEGEIETGSWNGCGHNEGHGKVDVIQTTGSGSLLDGVAAAIVSEEKQESNT